MGFVILEDLYGQVEGMVFPRVYARLGRELTEDREVLLSGRLSVREDENPKLIVEEVQDLREGIGLISGGSGPVHEAVSSGKDPALCSAAGKAEKRIYLHLPESALPRLEKVLENLVKGDIPVYCQLKGTRQLILMPRESWPGDMDEASKKLILTFGTGNVKIK